MAKLVLDGMENDLQLLAHVLRIGQKVDDNVITIPQFTFIDAVKKVGQICLVNKLFDNHLPLHFNICTTRSFYDFNACKELLN